MKRSLLALVLVLTVASWAQTATQTAPPSNPAPAEKAKSSCCAKMSAKDGASCVRHKDANSKDMASCCAGKDAAAACCKDAKSCVKDNKMAASCYKDGCGKNTTACKKDCGKGCCSPDKDKKDTTARNCCAKNARS